jgi:hypothetical protein
LIRDVSYYASVYLRIQGFFVIIGAGLPFRRAQWEQSMASVLKHRKVNIVMLAADEPIGVHCKPGDIAIVAAADGWWTSFIGPHGEIDSYDAPYPSYQQALWAAKAAAEFGLS